MKKLIHFTALAIFLLLQVSCKKSGYLEAAPSKKLVVPETLNDFQTILDNDNFMNGAWNAGGMLPVFGQAGSDDYFSTKYLTNNLPLAYSNLYTWNDDIYGAQEFNDWALAYRCAFYANLVLDGIDKIPSITDMDAYNNVKGSALFFRAHIFYRLSQVYAPPYDKTNPGLDLGIPLRLTSDINEIIERSTVHHTYERILSDLKTSLFMLPDQPLYKTRPSRPAAYALLAKTYLVMQDYDKALVYADSCLQLKNSLLDYSKLDSTKIYPFDRFHNEVIFHGLLNRNALVLSDNARVDSLVYLTYDQNDLRKTLFYKHDPGTNAYFFRGSYDGSGFLFGGLSVDDIYLIRAECHARRGNVTAARKDLNDLLIKRWKTGTFVPVNPTNPTDVLQLILLERRKELVFRGERWTDLRRLNKEGANISLQRNLNGQLYTLSPQDLRYTYLIPPVVIGFNPKLKQNPR